MRIHMYSRLTNGVSRVWSGDTARHEYNTLYFVKEATHMYIMIFFMFVWVFVFGYHHHHQ